MTAAESAPASVHLARAVAATQWRDLPGPVRSQAADLFLDTLAVIAAGSVHPTYAGWLARQGRERGECSAIGLAQGVPAASAALLNGGATTVLQWQDGHRLARGQPAPPLEPLEQVPDRSLHPHRIRVIVGQCGGLIEHPQAGSEVVRVDRHRPILASGRTGPVPSARWRPW